MSTSRKSASAPPPHTDFYANLPLRCLDLPLPLPPRSTVASATSICHYLDLSVPLPPRYVAASICLYHCLHMTASPWICLCLYLDLPLSPLPLVGLPTPTWSFHSQFLTVTFLDNPLSFLYFGFCLILNQCYFLWICDCDFELLFSFCDCESVMLTKTENWMKPTETEIQPKPIDF